MAKLLQAMCALWLMACEAQDIDSVSAPVINGTPSGAGQFPAVGALHYQGVFEGHPVDRVGCSGTLIAPDVVLTAAHCADPYLVGMLGLPKFSLDDDARLPTTVWTDVAAVVVHEGWVREDLLMTFLETPDDIALLFLSRPITGVQPMKIATPAEAPSIALGLQLVIVGYGQTMVGGDTTDRGLEQFAMTAVTEVGVTEFRHVGGAAPIACGGIGDSGGPALAMLGGELRDVGVFSHFGGTETNCDAGSIDQRVDAYTGWITAHAPSVCAFSPEACRAGVDGGPPAPPDASVPSAADAGEADRSSDGGCQAAPRSSSRHAPGWAIAALVLGLAVRWRRRGAQLSTHQS